jgi:hypothetical protein
MSDGWTNKELQAKRAGVPVGGPGLASNQGDTFRAAANPRVGKRL